MWLCVQISGREMFEFNPELIEGDDDEADEVAYQREPPDDVCPVCYIYFFIICQYVISTAATVRSQL